MTRASDAPPMSRFRAFTTSLGFKPSGISRSSSDQSSTPSLPPLPVSTSSIRSLYGKFTLYLRVHSAQHLHAVAQGSYCKLYLGDTPIIGGFGHGKSLVGEKKDSNSHQTFHTKVQSATRHNPEWNEKFQLNVQNPNTEILTIRVKNHVLLYSPAIGACVVHLRQLQLGHTIDEWFPLYKNDKATGQLRLQLCLQENVPVPERRYSQASEETIQRLMQEHRELEEAQRRELELQQQEKWKRMEEDALKHDGVAQQIEREEQWRERKVELQQINEQQNPELLQSFKNQNAKKGEDSDSELPASFKYRGVKKEVNVAIQMENLNLHDKNKGVPVNCGISSGYTINADDVGDAFPDQHSTGFGTIRLSVEELNRVVQNALPTSESSGSTSSEYERRRRKTRDDRKRNHRKKYSKRKVYRDAESSDSRSGHSREHFKGSKTPEKKPLKPSTHGSVSSRSESSHYQNQQDADIPVTLTFPPSPSVGSSSSSQDERRRRRRRRAEKAKKLEHERKRRSKPKQLRNYESSYSSSSLSSSSSYLSSSEEERFRRKLKKKKARKARPRARAKRAESRESRSSTHTSRISYPHRLSCAESRNIDAMSPCVAQHWTLQRSDETRGNGTQRECHNSGNAATPYSTSVQQQPVPVQHAYGSDGGGFDELAQLAMPQYLGQTTKEQTNAEMTRSFCF
ncbi:hypothetical protein PHMEG_00020362 [Phytophthora megakarya]|uniref:C2 domain-containing protein n=1 Tax=Phytophthora megakarya TaxID=4795 RepID=A0A225VQG2_9STRA|nr:hypothetical protein PHMEG_00020362 [Phytophthora megakarya]